jgi:hypothetical protein
MRLPRLPIGSVAVGVAAFIHASSAQAISCEELRSSVEAKFRSNGVKTFSITVVEASDRAAGQVVGTCELGSRKLIYSRLQDQASSSVRAAAPSTSSSSPMPNVITECADGRVVTQGGCKR